MRFTRGSIYIYICIRFKGLEEGLYGAFVRGVSGLRDWRIFVIRTLSRLYRV